MLRNNLSYGERQSNVDTSHAIVSGYWLDNYVMGFAYSHVTAPHVWTVERLSAPIDGESVPRHRYTSTTVQISRFAKICEPFVCQGRPVLEHHY
jgi:hypothetical protein